ncbi:MAG: hypothetical protein AAGA06_13890 [Pseudomonadota bacterium]
MLSDTFPVGGPMRSTPFKIAGVCLALTAPESAAARCEGAVVLGALHDAYLATLTEAGKTRLSAAQTLLVLAGAGDGASLAHRVARAGVTVDADKLSNAVADAKILATDTLEAGRRATPAFRHSSNVSYLGEVYAATGCRSSAITASLTPVTNAPGVVSEPEKSQPPASTVPSVMMLSAAVFAVGGMTAVMVYKFTRSFFYRKRKVARMPRYPISMQVDLTYTDADGELREMKVNALDISRGGVKLNWPDGPGPGIRVTIPILASQRFCQIAWANAQYVGLMFESPLNPQELNTLKEQHKAD